MDEEVQGIAKMPLVVVVPMERRRGEEIALVLARLRVPHGVQVLGQGRRWSVQEEVAAAVNDREEKDGDSQARAFTLRCS